MAVDLAKLDLEAYQKGTFPQSKDDADTTLKDGIAGAQRNEDVDILILAIGGLAVPNECTIPGAKEFKGPIFHSARWRHDVSLKDKNVVVVGNGCSASQLIPAILPETKSVTQFIRTPQWYLKSVNFKYPSWSTFLLKYIPGAMWLWRFVAPPARGKRLSVDCVCVL